MNQHNARNLNDATRGVPTSSWSGHRQASHVEPGRAWLGKGNEGAAGAHARIAPAHRATTWPLTCGEMLAIGGYAAWSLLIVAWLLRVG